MNGLFITSNNTNTGKTFISCQIIKALNAVVRVEVRKVIETNCKLINHKLIARDADLLQKVCKYKQNIKKVCPYKFKTYASGELASIGKNITLNNLTDACKSDNFVIVEGTGGFYSPIIKNKLNSDFAKALKLPVIIVIEDKIGAICEALLTIQAINNQNLKIASVILNQKIKNNLDNYNQLQKYTTEKIISFSSEKIIEFVKKIRTTIL